MKRRALWLTLMVLVTFCAGCALWVQRERQQYACNRQLVAVLEEDDTHAALALVNAGADPNTRLILSPAPTIRSLLDRLFHHSPAPTNDSPTAFLIACGGDFEKPDSPGTLFVPLHEDVQLVQAMLAQGADIDLRYSHGCSALHLAALTCRKKIVELLLQQGADINAFDEEGSTPLMEVVSRVDMDSHTNQEELKIMMRLLLAHGANINARSSNGQTLLHVASIYKNRTTTVSELLAHGADPNLRDKWGKTPLMLAQEMNQPDLVQLFKQHGAK